MNRRWAAVVGLAVAVLVLGAVMESTALLVLSLLIALCAAPLVEW